MKGQELANVRDLTRVNQDILMVVLENGLGIFYEKQEKGIASEEFCPLSPLKDSHVGMRVRESMSETPEYMTFSPKATEVINNFLEVICEPDRRQQYDVLTSCAEIASLVEPQVRRYTNHQKIKDALETAANADELQEQGAQLLEMSKHSSGPGAVGAGLLGMIAMMAPAAKEDADRMIDSPQETEILINEEKTTSEKSKHLPAVIYDAKELLLGGEGQKFLRIAFYDGTNFMIWPTQTMQEEGMFDKPANYLRNEKTGISIRLPDDGYPIDRFSRDEVKIKYNESGLYIPIDPEKAVELYTTISERQKLLFDRWVVQRMCTSKRGDMAYLRRIGFVTD